MMTTIQNQIKDARIAAMKSGNKERRDAISLIIAQFTQTEVDTRKPITDDIAINLLTKMKKNRQESIRLYESAGATSKAEIEQYEINVIDEFLPEQMDESEIVAIIEQKIEQLEATSMKDIGKVIGSLKSELNGRADMGFVSKVVKEKIILS